MDASIIIAFGMPEHGWLPVDFHYGDCHLQFYASDVLNDPIEELRGITTMYPQECRQVSWWLEPAGYIFDFAKNGQNMTLTIYETDDLHSTNAETLPILTIEAKSEQITEPFHTALKQFWSMQYEEKHWKHSSPGQG